MNAPWRIIQGGQGAGKNWAIAQILLEKADEKKRTITVVTDTFENLKDGIIKDYKDMFFMSGMDFSNYYNESKKDLTWGDSVIQFRYVIGHKGQAGKSKRRNILYVNETTKVSYAAIQHYIARTSEICYFDLNPDYETWVHTEIEPALDKEGNNKSEKIIVTWRDNEYIPQAEIDYIESRKDNTEWYRVYGLGLTGTYSDRLIYSFEIVKEIPEGLKRLPSGMDFGQSPDPTCLVDAYLDGVDMYLDEIFEENNLMAEKIKGAERLSIVDRMDEFAMQHAKKELPKEHFTKPDDYYFDYFNAHTKNDTAHDAEIRVKIRAYKNRLRVGDSSGKTELLDLTKYGYNMRGAKKGPGSVTLGIKRLRSYNLKVTERSFNLIKGLQSWMWKLDHNEKIVPEPDGHEPDTLAATRYIVLAKPMW